MFPAAGAGSGVSWSRVVLEGVELLVVPAARGGTYSISLFLHKHAAPNIFYSCTAETV